MSENKFDLQAIRARSEAATPGPWEWRVCGNDSVYIRAETLDGVIELEDDYSGYPECGEHLIMEMLGHDADFIAHARTDIPAMLAEVGRLQAENERLDQINQVYAKQLIRDGLTHHGSAS